MDASTLFPLVVASAGHAGAVGEACGVSSGDAGPRAVGTGHASGAVRGGVRGVRVRIRPGQGRIPDADPGAPVVAAAFRASGRRGSEADTRVAAMADGGNRGDWVVRSAGGGCGRRRWFAGDLGGAGGSGRRGPPGSGRLVRGGAGGSGFPGVRCFDRRDQTSRAMESRTTARSRRSRAWRWNGSRKPKWWRLRTRESDERASGSLG